jgi:hypothetical protein
MQTFALSVISRGKLLFFVVVLFAARNVASYFLIDLTRRDPCPFHTRTKACEWTEWCSRGHSVIIIVFAANVDRVAVQFSPRNGPWHVLKARTSAAVCVPRDLSEKYYGLLFYCLIGGSSQWLRKGDVGAVWMAQKSESPQTRYPFSLNIMEVLRMLQL